MLAYATDKLPPWLLAVLKRFEEDALNISFKFRRTEKVVISQKQRRRVHAAKHLHAAAGEQRATHGLATTARRPDDHMHT